VLLAAASLHIGFQGDEVGGLPAGWRAKDQNGAARVYSVRADGEKKFLRADAKGASVQFSFEKSWALKELPFLQWEWRAVLFPTGTNEREKSGGDSVLGVYVVFGTWPRIRSIKYIWSDTKPVGETFPSPFSSSAKMIVVRSGRDPLNTWVTEKRDVLSDYRKVLGQEENPVARGIAVLTDADNTGSHAIGDYGDMRISASAHQ
jgi:hypothetical protein